VGRYLLEKVDYRLVVDILLFWGGCDWYVEILW